GDDVHQRTALLSGEDAAVESGREISLAHYHAGARPAERLVRGGSYHVRVRDRRGMDLTRDQPGEVRHVDHEARADLVRDLPHAREVELPWIRAAATDDHLRRLAHRDR